MGKPSFGMTSEETTFLIAAGIIITIAVFLAFYLPYKDKFKTTCINCGQVFLLTHKMMLIDPKKSTLDPTFLNDLFITFYCPSCRSLLEIQGIDWKTVVEDEDKGRGIYY